ncbi:thioredoxin [Haloprofundus marisrubri]|uniref:Thioredoxin n=1 Tax=Haloprofundus marisrubri TaxID=1514971 RepID=A0A0W1R5E8_9EURY|nr:thioredoxin family protein [Haloprofundus marisrubri]KTG08475.1 thioredoxin [Haloprofundus marisrubri]
MTADAADTDTDAQRRKPIRLSSGEELDDLVATDDLVLVDFYTKGCTLCQSIKPVVGNVARATDVTVAMLNPRDDLDLVERFNIRSVPTLLLFEDGELVGRLAEGFQGTDAILGFVEEHTEKSISAE